ncbi:MAG TPA: YceI family protein [Kofleriaceae bacterium]|nr:YceI family protein [Kofleriaceae bacterium]
MTLHSFSRGAALLAAVAFVGCGQKDQAASQSAPATEPAAETAETTPPAETPEAVAEAEKPTANADYITILAGHNPPKPIDPVKVSFTKFDVVQADFDPKNLEGGTAELVVDLSSIKTDSAKRDAHLQSPDYLDVAKFPQAHVSITKVKKTGDNTYSAEAVVSAHGKEVTWPVTFEVVDTGDDFVRVKAEHEFSRTELGVGKTEGDPTAAEMKVELMLTLHPNA